MSTHTCPAPGCPLEVSDDLLACRKHWYELPKPLRDALWRAYSDHGRGSPAHTAAVDACLRAFEQQGGGATPPAAPALEPDGGELARRDAARAAELRRCADQIEELPQLTVAQVVAGLRDRAEWWDQQAQRHSGRHSGV
jgi:hypothetical protein